MEKPTDHPEFFRVDELSYGLVSEVGQYPVEGFTWTSDVQLADNLGSESGPWLIPLGEEIQRYPVMRAKALVHQFAALAKQPSEDRIKDFADQFGSLGRTRLLTRIQPPDEQRDELLTGESLSSWIQASSEVATYQNLVDSVERGSSTRLAPFVEWKPSQQAVIINISSLRGVLQPDRVKQRVAVGDLEYVWPSGQPLGGMSESMPLASPRHGPPGLFRSFQVGDPIEPMRKFLQLRVNQALQGHVSRVLLSDPNGTLRIRYMPDRLLDVIYVRLQNRLAGGNAKETECGNPRCPDKVFIPKRRDQMFCGKNCQEQARYHQRKGQ